MSKQASNRLVRLKTHTVDRGNRSDLTVGRVRSHPNVASVYERSLAVKCVRLCCLCRGLDGVCPCLAGCARLPKLSWFQVACFQLVAFVWLKPWISALLKDAASLMNSIQEDISFDAHKTVFLLMKLLLRWLDHFILMKSFCIINVWMVSEPL